MGWNVQSHTMVSGTVPGNLRVKTGTMFNFNQHGINTLNINYVVK